MRETELPVNPKNQYIGRFLLTWRDRICSQYPLWLFTHRFFEFLGWYVDVSEAQD